jgi:hypothetical protein
VDCAVGEPRRKEGIMKFRIASLGRVEGRRLPIVALLLGGLLVPQLAAAGKIKLINCTGRRLRTESHDTDSGSLIPADDKQIKKDQSRKFGCATTVPVGNGVETECLIKVFKLKEWRDEGAFNRPIFQSSPAWRGKLRQGTYVVTTAEPQQDGKMSVTAGSSCP